MGFGFVSSVIRDGTTGIWRGPWITRLSFMNDGMVTDHQSHTIIFIIWKEAEGRRPFTPLSILDAADSLHPHRPKQMDPFGHGQDHHALTIMGSWLRIMAHIHFTISFSKNGEIDGLQPEGDG